MKLIYPLEYIPYHAQNPNMIFLAGSIEMGKAINWQQNVLDHFSNVDDITFLNPRRKDWDSSWKQDPDFKPFLDQVLWEQRGLSHSSTIFFYFAPGTISPVSMLELGMTINSDYPPHIIVCCPKEFHRYGNIKIICDQRGIDVHQTLDEAISALSIIIGKMKNE
jgi:hypothetical protein